MIQKRMKTIILIIAILITILLAIILAINFWVKISTKKQILNEIPESHQYDCILVLGAGVSNNNPSPMLKDRLNIAISLYEKNIAPKIIMSGDHLHDNYNEVTVMKNYAIAKGIPSENIFLDHYGLSTYDSIYRAKHIFNAQKIIIVSQEYHLNRALYIANKLALEAKGVSAAKINYRGNTIREAREILARNKDALKCLFKPEASYLNAATPVNGGNGDSTNNRPLEVKKGK